MNISDVMQEIAARLDTISGLTVHSYPAYRVSPPAAIVTFPSEYGYDETYARGADRLVLPVVLLVGSVDDRTTRDRIGKYADGSGPDSVKQVIESGSYTTFDTLRVTDVVFDRVTVGGDEYVSATFNIEILGRGA